MHSTAYKSVPHWSDRLQPTEIWDEDRLLSEAPDAFALDLLRPLEEELQSRKFINKETPAAYHPLWFIAESHRNTFLWRRGLSLADRTQFEFWIDTGSIARHRLDSLRAHAPASQELHAYLDESSNEELPHSRSSQPQSQYSSSDELHYLEVITEALAGILPHLHGLSLFSRTLRKAQGDSLQPIVLLGRTTLL